MEKICCFCKHFSITYEPDWSDVTSGAGTEIFCNLQKWRTINTEMEGEGVTSTFREVIQKAADCPDFEVVK